MLTFATVDLRRLGTRGYNVLDELPPTPPDVEITWHGEVVTHIGYQGRSYSTGQPTFAITAGRWKRTAHAADLTITVLPSRDRSPT